MRLHQSSTNCPRCAEAGVGRPCSVTRPRGRDFHTRFPFWSNQSPGQDSRCAKFEWQFCVLSEEPPYCHSHFVGHKHRWGVASLVSGHLAILI